MINLLQLLTALSEKEIWEPGSPDGSGTEKKGEGRRVKSEEFHPSPFTIHTSSTWQSRPVVGITQDSRCVQPGFVFVCISGYQLDGHDYIEDAIHRGAVAVVIEEAQRQRLNPDICAAAQRTGTNLPGQGTEKDENDSVPLCLCPSVPVIIIVRDGREALALLSTAFYQYPSRSLRVIGITGTNGKTTTSYLVASILESAGFSVGLINTLTCRIKKAGSPCSEETASVRTTPESVDLQRSLRQMVDQGCQYAVVEVSSHSLVLSRVLGCEFDVGVLTNITSDHLDFHKTLTGYRQAKLRLFSGLGSGGKQSKAAVLNLDDPSFPVIEESTSVPVFTYGFQAEAQIRADRIIPSQSGIAFEVHTQALLKGRQGDGETGRRGDVAKSQSEVGGTELPASAMEIISPLTGLHNVSNILAAIGVGLAEGIDPAKIREGIRKVSPVPGRFETIDCGQDFWVVVDFAHTADALQNLLQTARHLGPARIMTVFGCGGDRDQSKRFPMGQVAATLSDQLIITNDNSRSEDPAAIARQIEDGVCSVAADGVLRRYEIILDRYQAIQKALSWAEPGDMVLIAGKGHEQYQVIGSQCIPFDDRQVARHILNDFTADTQAGWKPLPE